MGGWVGGSGGWGAAIMRACQFPRHRAHPRARRRAGGLAEEGDVGGGEAGAEAVEVVAEEAPQQPPRLARQRRAAAPRPSPSRRPNRALPPSTSLCKRPRSRRKPTHPPTHPPTLLPSLSLSHYLPSLLRTHSLPPSCSLSDRGAHPTLTAGSARGACVYASPRLGRDGRSQPPPHTHTH